MLLTTDSRHRYRFVKPYRGVEFGGGVDHGRLPETSGRKWRIRAAQIRPKATRSATNATSIAVVKLACKNPHTASLRPRPRPGYSGAVSHEPGRGWRALTQHRT